MVILQRRKKNRVKDYDYSQSGAYFITICVKDKREMLCKIPVGANCVRPVLLEYGQIAEREIAVLSETYSAIDVACHIIMPNHIHMINVINNEEQTGGRTQFAPTNSRVIKQFKGSISKKIGFSIWQKSFHDHIIRNEEDYTRIYDYIENNPITWEQDCHFVSHESNVSDHT